MGCGLANLFYYHWKFGGTLANPGINLFGDVIPPNEIFKEGKDPRVGFSIYKLRHSNFLGC